MNRLLATIIAATVTLAASAQTADSPRWTGTWAAAAEYTGQGDMPRCSLAGTTLRQVVQISAAGNSDKKRGSACRLQLSNEFGSSPVEIKAVYVANALDSCDIQAKTATYLTFSGKQSVTIAAGEAIYSDAFHYSLQPRQKLAITISYGKNVPEHATSHRGSRTTSYIMDGLVKPNRKFVAKEKVDHWYNIAKLETETCKPAVAILGNSITDGRGSTTNLQNRWPDFLAAATAGTAGACENSCKAGLGILNLGIGGNCVVEGGLSEPALKRFDRDILGQQGVSTLIIFEGTNDIGCAAPGKSEATAQRLIAAYKELTDRAHAAGLTVIFGTITPFKGNGWYSLFHEAARQTVNEWIRRGEGFEGIIDFDELVRDPAQPDRLLPDYSDDWLHLNPKGYEAMGQYAAKRLAEIMSTQR